ncbi:Extracellular solute-binding protein family 1 [Thermobacillus xylanilyticus]|uniref:Extracellular solute-binding protein family 1 n=1 Tax=Thermobacillus xylanilyticus TaxID=76633 RepID=A0ABN7S119_THEXY|nr:Extracellular solute-binding protein family 1 [Thermobacillus xylanilyticus]
MTRAVLLLLTVMLAAGGCGRPVPDQPDGAGKERVTITYATWGSPNERAAHERIVRKFMERYPQIEVVYRHIPEDYVKVLTTLYAGNQAPDVYMLYKHTAVQWAEQGKLYDLRPLLEADPELGESSFIPNAVMRGDGGSVIGIKATEESFALYYNAELFRKAGLEPPPTRAEDAWSWDEFVAAAKRLTIDSAGRDAFHPDFDPDAIVQYGVRINTWMWHLMVPSNNASIIAPDGTGMNLDDPDVIDAVQRLADLMYVHHVAPNPLQEKHLPQPALALESGMVAMNLDGQWIQLDLGAAGADYGVGVLPRIKSSHTIQFGEPLVMAATTRHPQEAWLFFKWLLDPENAIELHADGLWMPILLDYYTQPELIARWASVKPGHPDGYEDAVMRQTIENGVNSFDYYLRNNEKIAAILNPALDQVWLGRKSVREAFRSVAADVQAEFRGLYR